MGGAEWGMGVGQVRLSTDPTPTAFQELFSRVRPCECLGSVWSQRDRPGAAGIAPTVRATVTQFNMVTGCVLGSVLAAPGLAAPQRAQRLEKWIRIAQVPGRGRCPRTYRGRGGRKAGDWGRGVRRAFGAGRCQKKSRGAGCAGLGPGTPRRGVGLRRRGRDGWGRAGPLVREEEAGMRTLRRDAEGAH